MRGQHRTSRRIATDSDTSNDVAKTKTSRGGRKPKPRRHSSDEEAYHQAKLDSINALIEAQNQYEAREALSRTQQRARSRLASSSSFYVDSDSSVPVKKSRKSTKKTKYEAPPSSDSNSDSSVVVNKRKKSFKSKRSTKKAKHDAQPLSDSDTDSDYGSDSPVPAQRPRKPTNSSRKPVEPSSEAESEDGSDTRRNKRFSRKNKTRHSRHKDGARSDTSNPRLRPGRKVDLHIKEINQDSMHTFAQKAATGHNSSTSGAVTFRVKGHPSETQIREALAQDPRDYLDVGPEGFGAQRNEDTPKIVFASRYGATRGCQLNLCGAAFMLNKQCADGIDCTLVHAWPNRACMDYLATQPSPWGREAFKKFCAEYHPKWIRNWNKFYKNHARTEPIPSLPVSSWLGPRSHEAAAKKAHTRTSRQNDRSSDTKADSNGKPEPATPRGGIVYGSRLGVVNPLPALKAMVGDTGKHDIRQPSQDMLETIASPTFNGQYQQGSFQQKKKDWNDPILLQSLDAKENACKQAALDVAKQKIAQGAPVSEFTKIRRSGPPGNHVTKQTGSVHRRPDISAMTADQLMALALQMKKDENESRIDVVKADEDAELDAAASVPQIVEPIIPESPAPSAFESERRSKKEEKKEDKGKAISGGEYPYY